MKAIDAGTDRVAELLERRAPGYFGWAPARVNASPRGSAGRRRSRLLRYGLASDGDAREVVVKVPRRDVRPAGRGSTPSGGPVRPRLVVPVEASRRPHLEHDALALIHAHFSGLADPRFGTVRALDLLPPDGALVMEVAEGGTLRDLLAERGTLLPRGDAERVLRNAGAWLREYHGIDGVRVAGLRHARREAFTTFLTEVCAFLGTRIGDAPLFREIAERATTLAEEVLHDPLPLGLGHGDFAARNIVVGPGGRVTVLDTLARFRTPIFEDLGYFLADLRCGAPAGVRGMLRPDPARADRDEAAFLDGYFGGPAPLAAVRLYEVQAMLDRWAALVAGARGTPSARIRLAAQSLIQGRRFRREVPARLASAPSPAKVADGAPSRRLRVGVPAGTGPRVAYIMSRFPKLTETFVLYEMIGLEGAGVAVEAYPLLRERQPVTQPDAERWVERARFQPFLSAAILRAQLHFLRRDPARYVGLFLEVLRETWRSPNFFVGALGIFPKVTLFAREMEDRGVDHVHAHFATHPALAAFIVHRLTGIPYSFTAHGSDLHVDRRMLDVKLRDAAFAVTVSEYNRELMVETCGEGSREKIHVVHCGVDTAVFAPRESDRTGDELKIVCVASFEEVKGHRYLLEACRLLRERGVRFRLDLVGDGPLRARVEARIVELGLAEHVHPAGPRSRPEVIRMLQEAEVAVLTSHPTSSGKREGIPVALMEAMACGIPVVASRISGIPELVESGRTGLLVPSADPIAVADALERLAGDAPLRRKMGRAARDKVVNEFSLEAGVSRLFELLQERTCGAI